MSYDPQSPSDRADMEPDAPVIDWNGKLHVVNGSPHSKPYPRDRYFWIVTDDAQAFRVTFWEENFLWTKQEAFHTEPDEFTATFQADEIMGWTDSQEDAEEAASLLSSQHGLDDGAATRPHTLSNGAPPYRSGGTVDG